MEYRFADFSFDSDSLDLRRGRTSIDLQPKVLRFIRFLLENRERTVSQIELLDALWPGINVSVDSLARVVSLARRGLGDGRGQRIIETRRGVGYRIGVPVEVEEERGVSNAIEPAGADRTGPGALAVLPFDNLGASADDEYFADGLAEDLITRISRARGFSVIARASSFAFRGPGVDLARVGRALGVRYVVLGSVRRAGNRVRVSVQLAECESRLDLWADQYDRELSEVFTAQDELSHAIVSAILPKISHVEQQRSLRRNPVEIDAWDAMMRGTWHLFRYTREDLPKAEVLLRQAIELDPHLASGWANLASCLFVEVYYGWAVDAAARTDEALQIARRAVAEDDAHPVAQFTLAWAYLFRGDHELALQAAERAIEQNPSLSTAHWARGVALTGLGRADDGAVALEEAIRLSPHDPVLRFYYQNLGIAHLVGGRYERAAECARKVLAVASGQAASHRLLAACHGHLGRAVEARGAGKEAMRLEPGFSLDEMRRINHPAIVEQLMEGWRKGSVDELLTD